MKPSTRWSTWPCATSPRSGPCLFITGNLHSIGLRWNSRSASQMTKNYLHKPLDRLENVRFRVVKLGHYLFSLFFDLLAGYGYKPGRSIITYLLVVGLFAVSYF